MAQINPPRTLTESRPPVIRDDGTLVEPTNAADFFEDNRTAILAAIIGLVVLALAVIAWRAWQSQRSEEGQQVLGAILTEYEAGNWQAALDGTDSAPGLLEIADDYGSTPTGEQATFFAADAYYQLGDTDRALELFEDYDGDGLLAASALAGQAAILEATDAARAGALFAEAAGEYTSPASTPGYLLDAARAYAAAGDTEAAQAALQTVMDDWQDTQQAQRAMVDMGMVQARASATGTATGAVRSAPVDTTTATAAPMQFPQLPAPAQ